MCCTVAGFAQINAGTKITTCSQPKEIAFYFGEDESLVLVFEPDSLAEFMEVAATALKVARQKRTVAAV